MKSKRAKIFPQHKHILKEVGENIKLARMRRKITTMQLSERADMNRTTLYHIERGRSSVAIGSYFNVLRVLNLHTDFLKLAKDDKLGRKLQDMDLLNSDSEEENTLNSIKYELRNRLSLSVKRGHYGNNNGMENIVKCSIEELINYLNDNEYNLKVNGQDVDIDHIVPLSKAKTESEVKDLFHYSNLQLLPSYYNRSIKSDNEWDLKHFENWFNTF